jgi:hypothetical protein
MWIRAFRHACTLLFKVPDILDLLEQYISLPGDSEILPIGIYHLQHTCASQGCYALDHMHYLLLVYRRAESVQVLELLRLLLHLGKHGLEMNDLNPAVSLTGLACIPQHMELKAQNKTIT